ncbi:MAG: MATE family efflux transporter [Lachnospiraceae bacterium]|nr:MATE family efflux transporter [Lachnospiraceae bacterium]MCI7190001.1 MATE family efflux transporter [Lachnospiraceae bacterium]MDD7628900.1 MATE family efflux transporter [Lachnospiraceae bacterium]MDY4120395.1 MATE family efflux transporter [Lachnospiraceae bacterium]
MQDKEKKMATEAIGKLMISMAVPSIIAQIINILYSIVDRIYIGHIKGVGMEALTGVGVTFPIITLISAFSAFVGAGGAPLAAIWLGKGDRKRAEKILGNGVTLLVFFTVILMAFFYAFQKPLLYLFGASNATIGYAVSYISIYLAGTIFVELALGLNAFIISQGQSRTAMMAVLLGAASNIILDPIFIFALGMGVKGAAYATVISQALSALWTVGFLISRKSSLTIKWQAMKPDFPVIGNVMALGISPFIMRATESLISIVLNNGLQKYGGDIYVGSLTIMQSVMQMYSAPLGGFTQGVQPIISYNFGAGNFDRVKKLYRSMITVCFLFAAMATVLVMIFPGFFAGMFTNDAQLIALVEKMMPIFMCGMLIFGLQQGIQPTFLALGQAKLSLFIAIFRKVILLVPLALVLPLKFGVMGIYYAEPVSDVLSAVTATVLFLLNIKKIVSKETLQKI